MAKVEYINAIMSGKLGGSVYSRNRAGAYVRQWVKPINPNTMAQQTNRISFGTASNNYHSLGSSEKALWSAFAPFYNPKGVSVPSGISGFNVYVGMNQIANMCFQRQLTYDVLKNDAGSPITVTHNDFSPSNIAPSHQIIADYAGAAGQLNLISPNISFFVDVAESGAITVDVGLATSNPPVVNTPAANPMTDSNGQQYGLAFYMSRQVQQAHQFIANKENILLGSLSNFNITTPGSGYTTVNMKAVTSLNPSDYQEWVNSGDKVLITAYQVGINGMCNRIFSEIITVS